MNQKKNVVLSSCNGCRYCYANYSEKAVGTNSGKRHPDSPNGDYTQVLSFIRKIALKSKYELGYKNISYVLASSFEATGFRSKLLMFILARSKFNNLSSI